MGAVTELFDKGKVIFKIVKYDEFELATEEELKDIDITIANLKQSATNENICDFCAKLAPIVDGVEYYHTYHILKNETVRLMDGREE